MSNAEAVRRGTAVPAEKLAGLGVAPEEWDSVYRISRERPEDCAYVVLAPFQKVGFLLIFALLWAWLAVNPLFALTAINGVFVAFYLVLVVYKLYLIHLSLGHPRELRFSPDEVKALDESTLPLYTILVPMYREHESVARMVEGLKALDYPKDKLQVLLLLEEDDRQTLDGVRAMALPPFIEVMVSPNSFPKTKPKACNLGLARAKGEFLVIYDAEDRPDSDQLKKAVMGFRQCGEEIVCLQAKLNFYNQRQNLLTRLFTLEYSMWFDLYLPGIGDLRAPIPLGGTSNHFRTEKLRALMGWDPFNVTEDCDLGMRLARDGYETRMLDSTTWEEACSDLGYWIRQRSRWTKGYIQTYLVVLRRPFSLTRKIGLGRALGFHLMVAGTPLCLLINPVYWLLTLVWFIFRLDVVGEMFPFPIILWGLVCLFAGNFVFVYSTLLAAYRRGYYDLVKYALLVPVYWLLMSLGAWKGALQLITRPNYWEKTRHGFDLAAGYQEPAGMPAAEDGRTTHGEAEAL